MAELMLGISIILGIFVAIGLTVGLLYTLVSISPFLLFGVIFLWIAYVVGVIAST